MLFDFCTVSKTLISFSLIKRFPNDCKRYSSLLQVSKLHRVTPIKVWVRLNYATTHHDLETPTTSQNMSTNTHHQPSPAKICPPPPTTIHHQPKYIHHHPPPTKIYLPLPTISQKMDRYPTKSKIYSYITSLDIVLTVLFSSKCNIPFRVEILCDKVLISIFFKFQISTTFSTFYDI